MPSGAFARARPLPAAPSAVPHKYRYDTYPREGRPTERGDELAPPNDRTLMRLADGLLALYDQRRFEAMAAPSAIAPSFLKEISGSSLP
jgi:hypothetical protein